MKKHYIFILLYLLPLILWGQKEIEEYNTYGLAIFSLNGKYGITDNNNNEVVPAICNYIRENDNYFVCNQEYTIQIFDATTGKKIIPIEFDDFTDLGNHLILIKAKNKEGIFEIPSGNTILPLEWKNIQYFNQNSYIGFHYNQWKFINKQGMVQPELRTYDNFEPFPKDGYYNWPDYYQVKKDGKTGIIDSLHTEFIPIKYDSLAFIQNYQKGSGDYDEEYLKKYIKVSINNQWGIVNMNGKTIIPTQYQDVNLLTNNRDYSSYTNGFFTIKNREKYGVTDSLGKIIIPIKYDNIYWDTTNSSSLLQIELNSQKGIISLTGKEILPPIYDDVTILPDGNFIVNKNSIESLLDKTGKKLTSHEYDDIYSSNLSYTKGKELYRTKLNGLYGLINNQGLEIIPPIYDKIDDFYIPNNKNTNSYLKITKKTGIDQEMLGIMDEKGTIIIPPNYSRIEIRPDNTFLVFEYDTDKIFILDKTGKKISPK